MVALVTTIVGLGTIGTATINSATTVQAKKVPTVYPKSMRGTWYNYLTDPTSSYSTTKDVFTKTKHIRYYDKSEGKNVTYLHKYIPHTAWDAIGSDTFKALHWEYLTGYTKQNGLKWLNVKSWNEPAGIGGHEQKGGQFYNISKIKGNQVLTNANVMHGSKIHNCSHWYRSKKLAKKWSMHHYKNKGFIY